jgi:hypothetical protein
MRDYGDRAGEVRHDRGRSLSRPADVLAKQAVKEDLMTDVDPLTTEISRTRKVGSHVVSVIFVHELVERN